MTEEPEQHQQNILAAIAEAVMRHGMPASKRAVAEQLAREWIEAGFEDAEEVEDWLRARCFDPTCARALDEAGLTPEQAATRTRAGAGDYEETIGFKIANAHLTIEEARRIVTSDFWNT